MLGEKLLRLIKRFFNKEISDFSFAIFIPQFLFLLNFDQL